MHLQSLYVYAVAYIIYQHMAEHFKFYLLYG